VPSFDLFGNIQKKHQDFTLSKVLVFNE